MPRPRGTRGATADEDARVRVMAGNMAENTEQMADDAEEDLAEEVAREEVALTPSESADPQSFVEAKIPADIRDRYEIYSYRNAAVIISESHQQEFNEILDALRSFTITTTMIR